MDILKTIFPQDELDRISKVIEVNEKAEAFLNEAKQKWMDEINPLFEQMKTKLTIETAQSVIDLQSLALSYRQRLNEDINYWLHKRTKEDARLKRIKQNKFLFYATGFGLKTNTGEKGILIDGHIAENQRLIDMYDNHVDFLRSTAKNLESLGFTIKNIIDLMNYLGK
jgi:hypothetical protein